MVTLHDGGDPYDIANVETVCRECHIKEHRRKVTPEEVAWRKLVADFR